MHIYLSINLSIYLCSLNRCLSMGSEQYEARLFSVVSKTRTRSNGHRLKCGKMYLNHFYREGGQTVEKVVLSREAAVFASLEKLST